MNNTASRVLLLVATLLACSVQAAETPKPITHADYAQWRSIQGVTLSRDGAWAGYALVGQESDGEVVLRRLGDAREWRSPRGTAPTFSADGRYAAFAIQPMRAELDKARKDKKKGDDAPKPGVGLIDLATGKLETVERVKKFAWGLEGGTQLALLLEAVKDAKKDAAANKAGKASEADDEDQVAGEGPAPVVTARKKEPGTELLVIDAASGKRHRFKDVAEFVWARNGEWLAFSVSVAAKPVEGTAHEGVYLYSAADASARALLSGAGSYRQMQFDRAGKQLAFVSNRDAAGDKDKPSASFKLFHTRISEGSSATALISADSTGMPAGWAPSEHGALSFSKDGQRLFLGTAELPKAEPKDAPEPMKVDIWHWKDSELQSVQKVNAERDRQRSFRAVVHLDGGDAPRFVQLAGLDMPNLVVNENARFALGTNDRPYRMMQSWDALYRDAYVVDLQTGQRRLLASKLRGTPTLSPAGKYVLAFEPANKSWWAWSTADGRKIHLTGKIGSQFQNDERDVPEPAGPYGMAGWTADDASVVLYDKFDLWSIAPETLLANNLSAGFGRRNRLELRYVPLDEEAIETKILPAGTGLMLLASHDVQRSTGYYRLPVEGGEPLQLIHGDKLLGGLVKAKQGEAMLFTQQSFTEFPDLWFTGPDMRGRQKISAANPQQAQYRWGTQEVIEYTSSEGKKLRALLAKPQDFDPKKKYPMMVYIYEKMTDKLHSYVPPAPMQNINVTRYVSNGYLVLRPDIEYTIGHPGRSALNTVVPAVQQQIRKGFVDAKRVGIQGHSWGGYQISYLITRTNIFRAAEAGASMANMISGYGGIRWGTGVSRAFQYEQQQSRIGGTPWTMKDTYVENSPIFQVNKVQTPFLTIHNDEDDAVPYYQAIEFFTALRRLGKEAYWFNFNGEKHGLKERDNMKFFTVHMAEYFDHYLKDAPRPEWMDKPVPYLERGKRDVMPLFKAVN